MDFPRAFLVIILLLAMVQLWRSASWLLKNKNIPGKIVFLEGKSAFILFLILIYAFLWKYIGFMISSTVIFFSVSHYQEPEKGKIQTFLITVLFIAFSYFVFRKGFKIMFQEPLLTFLK
jgi:hypothetical protein